MHIWSEEKKKFSKNYQFVILSWNAVIRIYIFCVPYEYKYTCRYWIYMFVNLNLLKKQRMIFRKKKIYSAYHWTLSLLYGIRHCFAENCNMVICDKLSTNFTHQKKRVESDIVFRKFMLFFWYIFNGAGRWTNKMVHVHLFINPTWPYLKNDFNFVMYAFLERACN